MTERLSRIIGAFLLTSACYVAYAAAVVPYIEPPPERYASVHVSDEELDDAGRAAERQRADLANWFAEGDWELESPKILETSQGKLLFHDYQPLENGLVRIKPCSMVFLSRDSSDDAELRKRKALVLRAPQGAILRFDAPIDLKQARIGKLVGGELKGEIFISSGQRLPGPEDDLYIATRDVALTESEVTTPHLLDFRLGAHRGRGRGVAIELEQVASAKGNSELRGVKVLTLHEQVFVHLEPKEGGDLFPGGDDQPQASAAKREPQTERVAERSPPVEIRCQGPFTFDMQRNLAVFRKQVDVLRVLDGESDRMNGDMLKVSFRAKAGEEPVATPADDDDQSPIAAPAKLEPDRIEFVGEPVVIRAPSNQLQARAQYIEHDPLTRQVKLRDAAEAIVRHGDREIRAPEMTFVPDESGPYGTFLAVGRGRMQGTSPDDAGQSFTAEWQRRLHFRKFEGQYVLSAEGGARFEVVGKGTIAGEEIHAWLKERAVADPGTTYIGTKPSAKKSELIADRLLALGNVQIESTQLSGSAQRLEAWFEYVETAVVVRRAMYWPGEAAAIVPAVLGAEPLRFPSDSPPPPAAPLELSGPSFAPPPAAASAAAPSPTASPPRPYAAIPLDAVVPPARVAALPEPNGGAGLASPLPPARQFHVEGDVMRVLAHIDDRRLQFREAVIEGRVKLRETKVAAPSEQPLLIQGDRLHLTQQTASASHVEVSGNPAYVEARGLTMSGGKLLLDRPDAETNLLTVPGQGLMTLPIDRDLQGRPIAVPEVLHLTWQGELTFDGQIARFQRGVEARLTHQLLRTDRLEVAFDRPVRFGEPGNAPRPDIHRIDCFDGAYVESRTMDGPTLRGVEKLQARSLAIERPTGDFSAEGPGKLTSVRLGAPGKPSLPLPGGGGAIGAGVPAIPVVGPDGAPTATINYLHAKFERRLAGNEFRRETTLFNQVRVLYGPVADWNATIDPDHPESWSKQTVQIDCDQLQATAERNPATGTDAYNLVAEGNTLVEGSAFTARAPRLTYAQAKDLLVIEGDGRTDAELYHQKRPGAQPSGTTAGRFMVWPSTNRVQVDGATFLDLTPN